MSSPRKLRGAAALIAALALAGCSPAGRSIQNTGSDTMVNLAQAWAETFHGVHPEVLVQVSGGGSGVGIAALRAGTVDIANSSRPIKPEESRKILEHSGQEPREFIAGFDGLAVYVHKDNPLESISLEELAEIYGEGGTITRWSQLGIEHKACGSDEIIRVSRQSNSGTYVFFRETVLGKRDFRQGQLDMNGSQDVVKLVGGTPCAIGYSGMAYKTDDVKFLKVSSGKGQTAYLPSLETVLDKNYPIARPLYLYTLGEPREAVKEYLDWILSPGGQKVVQETGYIPLPKAAPPSSSPTGAN
jgi:phosphate transport system substrate-binding protein